MAEWNQGMQHGQSEPCQECGINDPYRKDQLRIRRDGDVEEGYTLYETVANSEWKFESSS